MAVQLNAKETAFTTIIGILLAPYATQIGIPPTSPAYPILIGALVAAVPTAYHGLVGLWNAYVAPRLAAKASPAALNPADALTAFNALLTAMQNAGLTAPSSLPAVPAPAAAPPHVSTTTAPQGGHSL